MYLVGVELGVSLAQSVQKGFWIPTQRLSRREEIRAPDVQADPLRCPDAGCNVPLRRRRGMGHTSPVNGAARLGATLCHPSLSLLRPCLGSARNCLTGNIRAAAANLGSPRFMQSRQPAPGPLLLTHSTSTDRCINYSRRNGSSLD